MARVKPDTEVDADVDAQVRLALATWPHIDPDVEGIVTRIARAAGYLDQAARAWIIGHWRYRPALRDGNPAVTQVLASVTYSLKNQP